MDEQKLFEGNPSQSGMIYSCVNLLNFGQTQYRQPEELRLANEGG